MTQTEKTGGEPQNQQPKRKQIRGSHRRMVGHQPFSLKMSKGKRKSGYISRRSAWLLCEEKVVGRMEIGRLVLKSRDCANGQGYTEELVPDLLELTS